MIPSNGFSCKRCGDGISYGEKFVYSMLCELNIDFITQLSHITFSWCEKYKYDFYIPSINTIVEVHGRQHYFDEESAKPLEKNTKFEFSIVTKNDIKESFSKLSELFSELASQMENLPVALQSGKNLEVSESIKKLADSIEQFCHIATLASLFPDTFTPEKLNGINFKEFFSEFSPILKDFEDALQNNDTVMLGDLSEYEICPRLKEISKSLQTL